MVRGSPAAQLEVARQRQAPAVAIAIEGLTPELDGSAPTLAVEPPATQAELAYWCLQHPAPGMQVRSVPEPGTKTLVSDGTTGCLAITWPYGLPHLGIGSTEEVLVTFSGEVADRHPPTGPTTDAAGGDYPGREGVRLLTWGDLYLTAWLEAVRGEPLVDADYQAAGLNRETNPLR